MRMIPSKYWRLVVTGVFVLVVFLFWFLAYPQWFNYQEQNQLFLFTLQYFLADVRLPGGVADYLGEFITQFFYVRWVGAMLLALLFGALQWLTWRLLFCCRSHVYVLSYLPSMLMLWHLSDVDVLMSYFVSLIVVLLATITMNEKHRLLDVVMIPVLFWTAGAMAWVYVLVRCLLCGYKHLWSVLYLLCLQCAAYLLLLSQWHFQMVLTGLNYYRIPLQLPTLQYAIPIVIVVMVAWTLLATKCAINKKLLLALHTAVVVAVSVLAVQRGFNAELYELLLQDELVRKERWTEVIANAEKHQSKNAFSSQCVNLSLAMTGQLPDRMFSFYQSGSDALLMNTMRDNTSNLPTAEAFFHLGMVNSALRYMFDIQQSILNFKGSGRCTKRLVECFIVNGNYQAADKHLELLRHTLFYRSWAEEATACLYNDKRVDAHHKWGRMRQLRYKEQFLYNYEEKDKMLGLLFLNNKENKLALNYFMGQMLLDGNIQGFMSYMSWFQQFGGYTSMPLGYVDAVECIKAKGNLPGSLYATYVQSMMNAHEKE